jgi:hypothetical protein
MRGESMMQNIGTLQAVKGAYRANIYIKGAAFWLIFMLMYGIYKAFPVFPLDIIMAVNESNFQHYKAAFFAFTLLGVIEYQIYRKRIDNRDGFLYSRMGTAIFAPWLIFLLWYVAPALYGEMPSIALEILYANVITILVGFAAITFERGFETMTYSQSLKTWLWVLFVVSIGLYVIFTYKLPWADVFMEPDWR